MEIKLGMKFILKKDILTRDGDIPKGTLCEIDDIMFNDDRPYRVIFGEHRLFVEGVASDWYSEEDLIKMGLK